MHSDKLQQIKKDILIEMYEKSTPSLDYNDVINDSKTSGSNKFGHSFYQNHYLSIDKQEKIIDKHINKYDLEDFEKTKLRTAIHLGSAPTTNKEHIES